MAGMIPSEIDKPKTVIADVPADTEMVEVPVDEATVPPVDSEPRNPDDDEMEEPNVSEDEQAAYEDFMDKAFSLIYADGKVNPGIVAMLDEDPSDLVSVLGEIEELQEGFSPIIALAATSVMVTQEVIRGYGEEKPEGDIIFHGGRAILEDLAQLAPKDFDTDELNKALYIAVDIFRVTEEAQGNIDKEALSEDFAELLNAQEEGREEEMLPGIGRFKNGDR